MLLSSILELSWSRGAGESCAELLRRNPHLKLHPNGQPQPLFRLEP